MENFGRFVNFLSIISSLDILLLFCVMITNSEYTSVHVPDR